MAAAPATTPDIYLDWAASTPMRADAIQAMVAAANEGFGNPTGSHHQARTARRLVDDARDLVADAVGAEPSEVIFCGSGTEADNLAVFGAYHRLAQNVNNPSVACAAVEHHAVLHPVKHLGGTVVDVGQDGLIDLDQVRSIANADLAVLSVMLVNNETGVIQPLEPLREILDEHAPQALLHTDAVQAFPWIDVSAAAGCADLISLSGHKFGGPKGVGALIVRDRTRIAAQVLGGGQEFELRSGTHNVAGIAAFGVAAERMHNERAETVGRVARLRDSLVDALRAEIPDLVESAVGAMHPHGLSDRTNKAAGSAHVCFPGIESEALLFLLERQGLSASAASSCASGAQDPSHVLAAMGWSRELAAGSLRLSLGFGTTEDDVTQAAKIVPKAVHQLRASTSIPKPQVA